MRFREGSVDSIDQGGAKGKQGRVHRIAAVGGHPNQPGGRHHAGNPLLRKVSAIVELVEAWRLLNIASNEHEVAEVSRRQTIDGCQEPKVARGLPQTRADLIDLDDQAMRGLAIDGIVVNPAGDEHTLSSNAVRQGGHGRDHSSPGAQQEGDKREANQQRSVAFHDGDRDREQRGEGQPWIQRAHQHCRHDADTPCRQHGGQAPPRGSLSLPDPGGGSGWGVYLQGTTSDFANCL